jgi:hypothetical protein
MTTQNELTLKIELGALCPSLKEQLAELVIDDAELALLDQDADAITRLHIRGLIPEAVAMNARRKLVRKIQAALA